MKFLKRCLFIYAVLSIVALALIVSDSTGFSDQLFGKSVLPYGVDKWLFLVAVLGCLVGVLLAWKPRDRDYQQNVR